MHAKSSDVLDEQSAYLSAIGADVIAALPRGWAKAWLYVERRLGSAGTAAFFVDAKNSKAIYCDPPDDIAAKTLAFHGDAGEAWTSLTMVIESDGKFAVDFGYDPVPVEEGYARRQAWKARYLPKSV